MRPAIVACVLAIGLGTAPVAQAQPAEAPREALVVRTAEGMLMREAHGGWVQARARRTLDEHPGLPRGSRIVVEVGGITGKYALTVSAFDGDALVSTRPQTGECRCTTEELLDRVEVEVEAAADRLVAREQAERREAEEAEAARRREQQERQRRREAEQRAAAEQARLAALAAEPYRPEPLGLAGMLGLGLGSGMIVGGAVIAARRRGAPTDNDFLHPADLRPPGYALLGTGVAVLSAGASLWVVDLVRCRRDRVACGQRGGRVRDTATMARREDARRP